MNHCIPRDFVFRSLLDNVEMRANGHMEVQLRLLLPLEQMWYVLTLNIRYYVVKLICIPIYIKSFIFSGGRRAVDNKMQKALCVTCHISLVACDCRQVHEKIHMVRYIGCVALP